MDIQRSSKEVFDEIQYNLSIMERTSKGSRAADLDVGFLSIFENDIKLLSNMSQAEKSSIERLSNTLQEIAARMYAANPKQFSNGFEHAISIPLISEKASVSTLALPCDTSPIAQGLRSIGKSYDIMRVRGDGHCLFRSVSSALLLYKPEAFDAALKEDYRDTAWYPRVCQALRDLKKGKKSALNIMNDKETSDAFVEMMRFLSTEWLGKHWSKNEVFLSDIQAANHEGLEQYLRDMRAMDKRRHGGQPELEAMQSLFGIALLVLNASSIGRDPQLLQSHKEKKGVFPCKLLLRGDHYDLAISK